MVDQEDEDLERIRRKKLEEMMKSISERTEKTGSPYKPRVNHLI